MIKDIIMRIKLFNLPKFSICLIRRRLRTRSTTKDGLDVLCDCFDFLYQGRGFRSIPARNLTEFPNLRQRSAMEPLFHFALALLSAGAPWLAAVIVVAIALTIVGPVRLSLSIGDRSGRRGR
jgi:hypothetical protein